MWWRVQGNSHRQILLIVSFTLAINVTTKHQLSLSKSNLTFDTKIWHVGKWLISASSSKEWYESENTYFRKAWHHVFKNKNPIAKQFHCCKFCLSLHKTINLLHKVAPLIGSQASLNVMHIELFYQKKHMLVMAIFQGAQKYILTFTLKDTHCYMKNSGSPSDNNNDIT